MIEIPSKKVMDILRPYDILSRVVGIRAFNFKNRFKSALNLIFPVIVCGYYIIGWITGKNRSGQHEKRHKFHIIEYLYFSMCFLQILTVVTSIILGFLHSKFWEKLARSLDEVDKTLEALGSKARFRRIYIRTLIEFTIFFVYLFTCLCSWTYTILVRTQRKYVDIFSIIMFLCLYVYGEIVKYTVTMDFLTIVRCISSELQRANDLLTDVNVLHLSSIAWELAEQKENNNNNNGSFKKIFTVAPLSELSHSSLSVKRNEVFRIRQLLRTIRQVYLELYKISKNLSGLYGIQVSLGMSMNIFYYICFLYTLYTCRGHIINGRFLINEILAMYLFCFLVSSKIVLITVTCDKATQEAQKIKEILYTFYAENTDYEIQGEINMFSMQSSHCCYSYSAYGLYCINCKFICSCLGIVTTCLVIMIQMA